MRRVSSRFENSSVNCLSSIKALKMTFYGQIPDKYYNISCLYFSNRTQLYFFLKQMENIKNKPRKDFIIMSTSQWSLFFLNVTFKK